MPGTTTLAPEVTHVSKHGFWLLLADEELLVPFDQFPWFRKGTIEQISNVQWPSADHPLLAKVGRRFIGSVPAKSIRISTGFGLSGLTARWRLAALAACRN
jgi:hypothetical protein